MMQGQGLQKLEGFRLTTLYSKQMSVSYNEGKMNVIMVDPVFLFKTWKQGSDCIGICSLLKPKKMMTCW